MARERDVSAATSSSDEGSISDHSSDEDHTQRLPSRGVSPSERGRARQRTPNGGSASSSACLSRFYRERFGDHSPDEYLNLRVSGIKRSLSRDEVNATLEAELSAMTPFEIKIVRNPEDEERLAYVNFSRPGCAKTVRRELAGRLQHQFGVDLMLDPTGVLRDQDGKYIPDRFNRAQMADTDQTPNGSIASSRRGRGSPPSYNLPSRHGHANNNFGHNNNQHDSGAGRSLNLNREDHQATRTLFVGNLPGDVRQHELLNIFEAYGAIEDIDVKMVNDGLAAYAFIVFKAIESAMRALKTQHGHSIRPDSKKCGIGYGRAQVSSRLWVGGLGDWTTRDMLRKTFTRYGDIDLLEYAAGDAHAYVRFASSSAAMEACVALKSHLIDNVHRIQVDYAKDKKPERKRAHSPGHDGASSARRRRGPQTPSPTPRVSSAEREAPITSFEELSERIACTWKGHMLLKKAEYALRLHRVAGREHLIQDLLRDADGLALRLKLDQRVAREPVFADKLLATPAADLTLAVGVEGTHSFTPLIDYLDDKRAIGMASVPNGALVYVLPHCPLAARIGKHYAPHVELFSEEHNYLLIIIKAAPVT